MTFSVEDIPSEVWKGQFKTVVAKSTRSVVLRQSIALPTLRV